MRTTHACAWLSCRTPTGPPMHMRTCTVHMHIHAGHPRGLQRWGSGDARARWHLLACRCLHRRRVHHLLLGGAALRSLRCDPSWRGSRGGAAAGHPPPLALTRTPHPHPSPAPLTSHLTPHLSPPPSPLTCHLHPHPPPSSSTLTLHPHPPPSPSTLTRHSHSPPSPRWSCSSPRRVPSTSASRRSSKSPAASVPLWCGLPPAPPGMTTTAPLPLTPPVLSQRRSA